jgi:hypothetical protein
MKRNVLEVSLAVLALTLAASAARRAAGDPFVDAPVPVPPAAQGSVGHASAAALARAQASLVRRNPFRINHSPAIIRVGQAAERITVDTPAGPLPPVRPELLVRAIVGGPPWSALVERLPTSSGAVVVREGDVFGTLTIGVITRDTLALIERDSVWKFAVHRNPQ